MPRPVSYTNFTRILISLSTWETENAIGPLVTLPSDVSSQLLLITRNIWKRRYPVAQTSTPSSGFLRCTNVSISVCVSPILLQLQLRPSYRPASIYKIVYYYSHNSVANARQGTVRTTIWVESSLETSTQYNGNKQISVQFTEDFSMWNYSPTKRGITRNRRKWREIE
jgi:hypothetical protein